MRRYTILAIVLVLVFLFAFWRMSHISTSPNAGLPQQTITVAGQYIIAEIANSEAQRQQGLSGRSSLAQGHGMLFVFNEPGLYGFWMKDMHFSIDILFADAQGTIVTIASNVAPETFPKSFNPASPALYVLELPAGYAQEHGIGLGSKIVL